MKAMVLAAGIGSRMRPITETRPKALIEVGGVPMLERVLRRLIDAGVDAVIVNVHHLADQVTDFLKRKKNFGIRVEISRETELLDTGGGLKKAGAFFDDGKPFLLHNVDVLSEVDLGALLAAHKSSGALATLAARTRESRRRLLFDRRGRLVGRLADGKKEWTAGPVEGAEPLGFDGIHAISPAIFPKLSEAGAFSIVDAYLRLAGAGEQVAAFRTDAFAWQDIGSPDKLEEARRRAA